VKQRTGVGRSFIYSADNFPKPIPLGDRAVGWLESEILAWIESRKAMRLQEAA
jgi:prophage regulatory protein